MTEEEMEEGIIRTLFEFGPSSKSDFAARLDVEPGDLDGVLGSMMGKGHLIVVDYTYSLNPPKDIVEAALAALDDKSMSVEEVAKAMPSFTTEEVEGALERLREAGKVSRMHGLAGIPTQYSVPRKYTPEEKEEWEKQFTRQEIFRTLYEYGPCSPEELAARLPHLKYMEEGLRILVERHEIAVTGSAGNLEYAVAEQ